MKTQVLGTQTESARQLAVSSAVDCLRRDDAVALPTETVYGLAADALNVVAALKIFDAKERPRFDPLIVHLPDREWLDRLTSVPACEQKLVEALIAKFWPGPLTLILPRRDVPDLVTAGLETVALRLSAHPIFSAIVTAFGRPLAAPSANRFGRISPTSAQDVIAELDGRIPLVVDAGPTDHGIESTIVAVRNGGMEILRHGPITAEELAGFGELRSATDRSSRPEAPGQLPSHYAPRTPLVLTANLEAYQPLPRRAGSMSFRETGLSGFADGRALSPSGNLREAAANLFRCLRELDEANLDLIVAEEIPEEGLGCAIMDRLRRAATR